MRNWARNTGRAAIVAAGFVAIGAGLGSGVPASADMVSDGGYGVLSGNQLDAPISVPVNVSGNSAAVLGVANAESPGGAHVANVSGDYGNDFWSGPKEGLWQGHEGGPWHGPKGRPWHRPGHGPTMLTSGRGGVGSGNQLRAPISIPIDICGNAVAVIGVSKAACEGGADVRNITHGDLWDKSRGGLWGHPHGGPRMISSGAGGVLSGNQAHAPISAPIDVCGNAIAVLGVGHAWCKGGATVLNKTAGYEMISSGRDGVLSGNQANAPVSAPINLCGNVLAVLGTPKAWCKGGAEVLNVPGHPRPVPEAPVVPVKPLPKPHKPHKPVKPHKPHKPHKVPAHRPATVHKSLPSTFRSVLTGSPERRPAAPAAAGAPQRAGELLRSVTGGLRPKPVAPR
ncbi:chaplin family protein, partial [Actinomadura fibrosa]